MMCFAAELVEEIVSSSQIPSGNRRQEVLRELQSHLEDFVTAAREAGHSDDEIETLVLANFGDPRQIAQGFAWVYRRERVLMRISAFVLCTLAVTALVSASVLTLQSGVAIGFGVPIMRVLASRHTVIEALDIVSTVVAYVGLISLERLFGRGHVPKAMALLAMVFATAFTGLTATHIHATFLVFGFVNGVFLRTIQMSLKSNAARAGVVLACFALVGLISFQFWSSAVPYASWLNIASWLVMGTGYQLMTGLVSRIDGALLDGLRRV